jgi:hypothetical protein
MLHNYQNIFLLLWQVIRGGKLPKVACIPDSCYQIIERCCEPNYIDRPAFSDVHNLLLKEMGKDNLIFIITTIVSIEISNLNVIFLNTQNKLYLIPNELYLVLSLMEVCSIATTTTCLFPLWLAIMPHTSQFLQYSLLVRPIYFRKSEEIYFLTWNFSTFRNFEKYEI